MSLESINIIAKTFDFGKHNNSFILYFLENICQFFWRFGIWWKKKTSAPQGIQLSQIICKYIFNHLDMG